MPPRKWRAKTKWKFAVGTTSLVPHTNGLHYMIIDTDTRAAVNSVIKFLDTLGVKNVGWFKTPNGWHVYTDQVYPWRKLLAVLSTVPNVDHKWLAIGRRRGYLFLADYAPVHLDWPVVRMVIHYGKKA